jgi:hypothetical protein
MATHVVNDDFDLIARGATCAKLRLGSVEAVLSFGGFLDIGSVYYPLPWRKLDYDTSLGGFRVDITRETLDRAPKYERDSSWSDWDAVDTHYGRGA